MTLKAKLQTLFLFFIPLVLLSFISPVLAATPIPCGQPLNSSISTVGEFDDYTFTASAQDAVTIRLTRTSGTMDPYLELYGPTGQKITENYSTSDNYARIDQTLYTAGTYTIRVSDYGNDEMGNYSLICQWMNNLCNATPLTCGQTFVTCGTCHTVQHDFFTFQLQAQDKVTIRLISTSDLDPYLELYDPTGWKIAEKYSSDNFAMIDTTLSDHVTYSLVVSDTGHDETGGYRLTYQRFSDPCNAIAISCGQTLVSACGSCSIGQQDFYTFSANAGDVVSIEVARTSGTFQPVLELYGPEGHIWGDNNDWGASWARVVSPLPTTDTYTVIVSDKNNDELLGGYRLTWQKLKNPCDAVPLTCGETHQSSLGAVGEQDLYTFTASDIGGTGIFPLTVRFSPTSGSIRARMELYDWTGSWIWWSWNHIPGGYVELDRVVPTGTYTVAVYDMYNEPTSTGDYTLTWQRYDSPCDAPAIICGQTLRGLLDVRGQQGFHTFTANANDSVALTLARTSGDLFPCIGLYYPSGQVIYSESCNFSGDPWTHNLTIPSDYNGTVVVAVFDRGKIGRGSYTLKFQKNGNSCPEVLVTAPNGGEIIQAGSTLPITWTATSTLGLSNQEIRLSTDGGLTFPTVIATGVVGQSFDWPVPANLVTTKGRIGVTVTEAVTGISPSDDSDADFFVRPSVTKAVRGYTYDRLNRLIRIDYEDGSAVTYTYDAVGNRLEKTHTP